MGFIDISSIARVEQDLATISDETDISTAVVERDISIVNYDMDTSTAGG